MTRFIVMPRVSAHGSGIQSPVVKRTPWVVTVLLLFSAACSTTSGNAAMPDESQPAETGITLNVATFTAMGFEELIDQWEHDHPGVTVRILGGTWEEQNESLMVGYPEGASPDVAAVETDFMAALFARPNRFVDLRDYGADELADRFLPWRWDQGVGADGEILGLPTDVGGLAIAYRRDLFEAAGLPTGPEEVSALFGSWGEYLAVGRDYTGSTGLPFLDNSAWMFNGLSNQAQGRYEYSVGADGLYQPSEMTRHAWDLAVQAIPMSADVDAFTAAALNTQDPQQQFATIVAPAWMTNFIAASAPRSEGLWGIARIPDGCGNWGGSQLTIPSDAEHPELAWDLISFLSTPAAQLSIFEYHGNLPSIPALYDHPTVADHTSPFFADAPVGQIYTESVDQVTRSTMTLYDRFVIEAFQTALGRIRSGKADPDTAWREAVGEIRANIAATGG